MRMPAAIRSCAALGVSLLLSLALACSPAQSPTPTPADGATDGATRECRMTCPPCAANELCLPASLGAFLPGGWDATCLRTCQTTSDCPSGLRCISIYTHNQPVCISDTVPSACSPLRAGEHCDFPGPNPCQDANTMVRTVSILGNHLCGHERINCPSGCANGACR